MASSKYSPYKSASCIWELDWEEFISALDWVKVCDAGVHAATVTDT